MPQPPTLPILAHENVRTIPSLSQKTFRNAALGNGATMVWEFDLAGRITDPNEFLNANVAPANSSTTAGGGGGPQTTPQTAIGPWLDAFVESSGAGVVGLLTVEYAVDANPCNYFTIATSNVTGGLASNISGLRVTARFVRVTYTNNSGGAAAVELGIYVRNT